MSHGEQFPQTKDLPVILPNHLFWLKFTYDFAYWNRTFLLAHSVTNIPVMLPPPNEYREQYRQRHPGLAKLFPV